MPASRGGPVRATGPCAILIGGAPGTGKSTLAAALAPRLGAAVLDLDVATGPLTAVVCDLVGAVDLSDPRIARLTRTPRYETLYALAEDNLRAGISVILVAPFTTERSAEGRAGVTERLAGYVSPPVFVWLHLSDDEMVGRLARRNAVRDRAKTADPSEYLASIGRDPPTGPHVALDGSQPVPALVERVLVHLSSS